MGEVYAFRIPISTIVINTSWHPVLGLVNVNALVN